MADLAFIDKYKGDKNAFSSKVRAISADLGIDPNWLMATMYKESKLNPQAQNTKYPVGGGYATGLIQFVPNTARSLGTSTSALYNMDALEQLDYVKKYFEPYKNRMRNYFDVYIAVFFPAAIGLEDMAVIANKSISASSVARNNPAIDLNKDGAITVAEFKEYLTGGFSAAIKNLVASTTEFVEKKKVTIIWTLVGVVAVVTTIIVLRKKITKIK